MASPKPDRIASFTPEYIPYPVPKKSCQSKKTNQKVKAGDEKFSVKSTEQSCSPDEPEARPYPVVFKKKLELDKKEMKDMNQLTIIESENIESPEAKQKKKKKRKTLKRRIATGAAVTGATALTACVFFPAAPFVLLGAGGVAGAQEYKIHKKKKRLEKEKEKKAKEPELQHESKENFENWYNEEEEKIEQLRKQSNCNFTTSQTDAIQNEFFLTDPDINADEDFDGVQKHLSRAFEDKSDDFQIFFRNSLHDSDLENTLDLREPRDENKYHSLPTEECSHFVEESEDETVDSSSEKSKEKENKHYLEKAYEELISKQEILSSGESSKKEIIPTEKKSIKNEHCRHPSHEEVRSRSTILEKSSDPELRITSVFLSSDEESTSSMDEEYFRH